VRVCVCVCVHIYIYIYKLTAIFLNKIIDKIIFK